MNVNVVIEVATIEELEKAIHAISKIEKNCPNVVVNVEAKMY